MEQNFKLKMPEKSKRLRKSNKKKMKNFANFLCTNLRKNEMTEKFQLKVDAKIQKTAEIRRKIKYKK